jgi:pyridoxine 5-phosphate synthase
MKKLRSVVRLGVNIDHVATLREVRGRTTAYPDLKFFVQEAKRAGAHQITIHLREDRRHIQLSDLVDLARMCPLDLNLEMAATPEMVKLAKKYRPHIVCLVPEKREELTTEGGLDVVGQETRMKKVVMDLLEKNIPTSMFIEPDVAQVDASYRIGARAVEFHTGKWVRLRGPARAREWSRLLRAAHRAHGLGLQVHAGHGLDYQSSKEIKKLPYLEELNIGHFLVCESLRTGFLGAVQKMVRLLQ